MARPRTPIAPGDPVWIALKDDEDQAKPGILVRWSGEEMKSNAIVQLADKAAGSHQIYPAEQVYYRRDGTHPSSVKPHRASAPPAVPASQPAPEPASAPASPPDPPAAGEGPSVPPSFSTDPYDQLIDVMGRCADKIDSVIKDAEHELSTARRKAILIRKKRAVQMRRIRAAIKLLRGEWGPGKGKKKASA